MGFKDCIATLRAAGDLDEADAAELARRYDDLLHASRSSTDPRGPEAVAKEALVKAFKDEAELKERQARLQADAIGRVADHMDGYGDLIEGAETLIENRNNRLAGGASVVGRRDALTGYAHGRLEQMLYNFRRTAGLGVRRNLAQFDDMVEGAFTGQWRDGPAKDFMQAYWTLTDELIDKFNAAGGSIGKLKNYLPQKHDARVMAAKGRAEWKDFIAPRLDIAAMKDPLTGGPLSPARLDEALDASFRRIVTNGAIDRAPSGQPMGRGKLANQRQDERFLVFKDGAAWKEYNVAFGGNDVYGALMGHISGLTKDIAALEILGPNPNATIEWMKQRINEDLGDKQAAGLSLPGAASGKSAIDNSPVQRLWDVVNGGADVANMNVADGFQAMRNFLTGVNLAGTALTAFVGDPFQQRWARNFAGADAMRWPVQMVKQLFDGASQREITRAGVIMEDAMQHLRTDLRGHSLAAASNELTKWLPDRVFQWTGLSPGTNANRRTQAMEFMFLADNYAGMSLKDMAANGKKGERFARQLEGFGIDESDWSVIRAAKALDHGEAGALLRPMDVIDSAPGDARVFDIAMRYSEAMHAFMEEAVPSGTNRAKVKLGAAIPKGVWVNEILVKSPAMYLSYPTTVLMSLVRAVTTELQGGWGRGGAFLASSVIGLTLGGAMIQTLAELRRGRDPKPADAKFWMQAMVKGGGFGFWGDYVFADMERGTTQTLARVGGPVWGLAGDILGVIDPLAFVAGEDRTRAKQAARMGQRYTPVQNMWWVRPATERLVWDRLHMMADPDAYKAFVRAERKLRKEGQGTWWGRAEALPRRAPDLSTLNPF